MGKKKYRKTSPFTWNDAKFKKLSNPPSAVTTWFYLMTHPHMTALGAMRATPAGLAAELGWPEKAFRKAFAEVTDLGMAKVSEKDNIIWLPNFMKHNKPESPNVLKSWVPSFDYLPECPLKTEILQHLKTFVEGLSKGFREAFQEAFAEALAHPLPNQEQEQEQEQESPPTPPKGDDGKAPVIVEPEKPDYFQSFWAVYPKKVKKQKAFEAWEKHVGDDPDIMRKISETLAWQISSDRWTRENGQFTPDPTTYLNQRRWTDEPPENVGPKTKTDEKFYGTLKNLFEFANEDGDSADD